MIAIADFNTSQGGHVASVSRSQVRLVHCAFHLQQPISDGVQRTTLALQRRALICAVLLGFPAQTSPAELSVLTAGAGAASLRG
jgi:hypothetical protein